MKVLITGASGFIGYHLSKYLCERTNYDVIGVDNQNNYYSVTLKRDRTKLLTEYNNFKFYLVDISDKNEIFEVFKSEKPDYVVNLAAQAGVRYSLENPDIYIQSNIVGFFNILEACRNYPVKHLLYASSSSVYGGNNKIPFSEKDLVDNPVSLYAATKKSNELMAYTYSHLYNIHATGLRFFTVYGTWGRPDMAYYSFSKKILNGEPIDVFNYGEMERDFTYIDDVIISIHKLLHKYDEANVGEKGGYEIFNIGNHSPVKLLDFISILEKELNIKAVINLKEMQPGDVVRTYADVEKIMDEVDFKPSTPLHEGLKRFVEWFIDYHDKGEKK